MHVIELGLQVLSCVTHSLSVEVQLTAFSVQMSPTPARGITCCNKRGSDDRVTTLLPFHHVMEEMP